MSRSKRVQEPLRSAGPPRAGGRLFRSGRACGALLFASLCLAGCRDTKPDPGQPGQASAPTVSDQPAAANAASAGLVADKPDAPVAAWATWPMPNAPSTGAPNPQNYDTRVAGVVIDLVTGLMWQRSLETKNATFEDARRYCNRLMLAGYDDWRLPSRIELVSLIDVSRSLPSISPAAFPKTPSDWFWTSSVASDGPTAAWYVYFYFGYPKTDEMTNRFGVRCVRGGVRNALPAEPRYDVQADLVRDIGTGLSWQRAVQAKMMSFDGARGYCGRASIGGQAGWRVPTLTELLTLVDERASNPTIDTNGFPSTPNESFWTSSTFADTAAMAWHVYFDHGNALYGLVAGTYWVRCVR